MFQIAMREVRTSKLAIAFAAILALTSGTPSRATNSNDGGPFIFEPGGNASASSNATPSSNSTPSSSTQRTVDRPSVYRARAQVRNRNAKRAN